MAKMSITLQVWGNNHAKTTSIQGEAGSRTIEVTFLDASGAPVDLTGCTPRMAVDNGAPEPLMNDGTIVDAAAGTADFTITSDMLTRPGDWPCEFALTGLKYPLLKANGMMLHIDASNTENIGGDNKLASLWIALNRVDAAAQQTEKAEKDSETAVANANQVIATITANESARQSNEQTRQSNETNRQTDETARKTAEDARASAESLRQSDETARQSQEQSRKDAESVRATAETTREGSEDTRKANETARQTAENVRESGEDTRKTDETARQTAENARAEAEKGRASAESARVTSENSRVDAESSRVSAENDRVTAESKRQADTQTAISGANTSATGANAAADRANTAAKTAEDAIAGNLDPAIDTRIAAKANVSGGIMGYDDAHAHITNVDIHVTTAQKASWTGKAEKSTTFAVTLSASAWTGGATPYSATVSVTGAKPEPTRIEVQPTITATAEQWTAWRAALIRGGGQSTGAITLLADGDKPTIDIPITVTIRGDVQ